MLGARDQPRASALPVGADIANETSAVSDHGNSPMARATKRQAVNCRDVGDRDVYLLSLYSIPIGSAVDHALSGSDETKSLLNQHSVKSLTYFSRLPIFERNSAK